MLSPMSELKVQAKKFLKDPASQASLLILSKGEVPQLKHSQLFIARKYGFNHWDHARVVLTGDAKLGQDQGSFWYKNQCATLLNHWCVSHQEAIEVQQSQGGTILPYKKQFVVVDKPFLTMVGVDYDSEHWQTLQHDWCRGEQVHRDALALLRIRAW